MKMEYLFLVFLIAGFGTTARGQCTLGGTWSNLRSIQIYDIDRGEIFNEITTNVEGITVTNPGSMNRGPYFDVVLGDSSFVITTNDAFEHYEEYETSPDIAIMVSFQCTGTVVQQLVTFMIGVTDTNNNAPRFMPSDELTYTITAPVAPGFVITGCSDFLFVRDIDLTTQRIDFEIEDNPYFEIVYDENASISKEFAAALITKTTLRNVFEPITLWVTATDVDLSGDKPLTTTGSITFIGDSRFGLPDEPIFAKPFYIAEYKKDHQVVLSEPMSLQSGFAKEVQFHLEGELSGNFELITNENEITIENKIPLQSSVLRESQIILVIKAQRESTSGDTATIIVQLPEGVPLEFEQPTYAGTITRNILQQLELSLKQGYEGEVVNANVFGEHSQYFNANIQGTSVILTFTNENGLPENVLNNNNFITLEVVVSSDVSRASTVVVLEIIKEDSVTPVFSEPLYTGSYETETGLTLDTITFTQGYDGITELSLSGDNAIYFEATRQGAAVTINIKKDVDIPPSVFSERQIFLTMHAAKPLTVGARTVIRVTTSSGATLEFDQSNYVGIIEKNILRELTLTIKEGYDGELVTTDILGEHSQYFNAKIQETSVILTLTNENGLPESVINNNNFITLEVVVSSDVSRASTVVVLEIIKEDSVTPVFSEPLYTGSYETETGLTLDTITFIQGYDGITELSLSGEIAIYFETTREGAVVTINIRKDVDIPSSVFNENIFLTLHAMKPLTVGARTAIYITTSSGRSLAFEQSNYVGVIENNILQELALSIEEGYDREVVSTEVIGEYSQYFTSSIQGTSVILTIASENGLPTSVISNNNFITLEVVVSSDVSRASTVVVLEIIKEDSVTPVFSEPLYTGSYETETGLTFDTITFTQGYDGITELSLSGENSSYFEATREGAIVTINITKDVDIPSSIFNEHIFLTLHASKPLTVGARTAIIIKSPTESPVNVVSFDKLVYEGAIELGNIQHESITITNYEGVNVELHGEYSSLFTAIVTNGVVSIQSASGTLTLPDEVRNVVLELRAANARAVLLLTVAKPESPVNVVSFDKLVYEGAIELGNIQHESITITNYEGVNVELHGEYSNLFTAIVTNGVVTIQSASGTLTLPDEVRNVVLELRAANARAVLLLTIAKPESPVNVASFDKLVYEGAIELGNIQHESITITNYEGVNVELHGEYSSLFTAIVTNGIVSIQSASGTLTLPDEVRHVVLELRAANARAVLLLTVAKPESPVNVVSFDKLVYEGAIELGNIQHESITITNYEGVNVELHGEYSSLFTAIVTNGVVSIQSASGTLTLPDEVRHVVLELRAANARAVLLLTVAKPESPVNVVSFDKLVYEGAIELGNIQHESITITNYEGVNVELHGEYSSLFTAIVTNGVVSIQSASGTLTLPDEVRHVVLELRAANARAVLLLTVAKPESPVNVVSFDKLVYEGAIELGNIQHESITITNYEGVNVEVHGEYSSLFTAIVTNGVVSVQSASGTLTLPDEVRNVVLELRAANARAVLLLTVAKPESPVNVVSFDKLVYEGAIELGNIQHESITITNYEGVNVELHGEYSSLFTAIVTNGVVSIQSASGTLTLPDEVRHVVLELRAANARAVLLLTVAKPESPVNVVSFDKLVYEGAIELGNIQHESITITNYEGVNVEVHGEYSSLFTAIVTNGVVSIQSASGTLTLPDEVRHVVLELRAANARAVLLLTVAKPESPVNVVSFDKLVYEGAIELGNIQHESITITNYEGVNVELHGEYSSLFTAIVTNGVVSIQSASGTLTLPDEVRHVVLELRAANARAVLLLTVAKPESPVNVVSFDKLVYEGAIELGNIQHESITITNYEGVNVELHGEYSSLFTAIVTNGVVSIQSASGTLTLPDEVRHVVLELRAANARAVLLLTVAKPESPVNVVSFDKLVYEGAIELGNIQHESITITNYEGVNVELHGEYSSLFTAIVTNGVVSIQSASGTLTLPDEVRNVVLELRLANARAVLLLTVAKPESPVNVVSFDKLVYEGAIELGNIQHESITITNYEGVNVELHGEYSSLFTAIVTNGVVSIQSASGTLTLPDEVRHVVLELRAANARAVLLLTVAKPESPVNVVSFDKLVYEGAIELGNIQHESITITNYEGVNVELHGEYSSLFTAIVTNGIVSIQSASGTLTLPDEVRHVVLELRAANARAVLLLTVAKPESPVNVVSFDKLVYEGAIELGNIQHESITITNYEGVNVELHGEYSSLFTAIVTNGVVSIQSASGTLTLPDEVRHVVLELRAANARAVLLLTVAKPESPVNVVSFNKLVYEGAIELGNIQHESITITNYEGVNVELHGEYSNLFTAIVTNGVVSIQSASGTLTLPDEVRNVVLELRAANARAVLLLTVAKPESPVNVVSFNKLVYEGAIELGNIQHESITITNYEGVNVELHGEYSSLFTAIVTNGVVSIQSASGTLTLPDEVRHVVLELRAANARAVLLLTVAKPESPVNVVSFDKLVYEGAIELGNIQHESITITNYEGVNVELHGEYSSLFTAIVTNGVVSIQSASGTLTLPDEVRHVVLELRAANARAVLLLTVAKPESPVNVVSFDKLVYEGAIELGNIQHESITITNYEGVNVELHGEYSSLFTAIVTNGVVSIQSASGTLTLPDEVRHVVLELRAANARAVLLLTVAKPESPVHVVSFDKLVYEGAIELGNIQHESITITNYEGVNVELHGEYSNLFTAIVTNGVVSIQSASGTLTLPDEVRNVVLELRAANARAVLLLTVAKPESPVNVVFFDKLVYEGAIELGNIQHESITITNYEGVNVELHGEYSSLFTAIVTNGVVSIQSASGTLTLPDEVRHVVLELRAANARAVLLLTVAKPESPVNVVSFDKLVYEGAIELGNIQHESITITNYEGVNVELHGEYSNLFTAIVTNGIVSIQSASGTLTLPDEVRHVVLELRAANARAVLLLTVAKPESPVNVVSFDKLVYEGAIELGNIQHESITITNYEGVNVELHGEYSNLFTAIVTNGVVSIQSGSGTLTLPDEVRHVVLELRAANARAVLLLTVAKPEPPVNVVSFDKLVYEGAIELGNIQHESITITNYEGVNVELHGEYSNLFTAIVTNGVVSIQSASGTLTLPDEVRHVVLELRAANARAVLLLTVAKTEPPVVVVSFDKLVYEGAIELGNIQHESIIITNYEGVNVELHGEYSNLFTAIVTNGVVSIQSASGTLTLPDEVRNVVLELRAANARAVLLLAVAESDVPVPTVPTIKFDSYTLSVDSTQIGVIGRVQATADNGEQVTYELNVNNAHLQERISINVEGELHLSAPANTGVYNFQITATTVTSKATATTTVQLTVQAVNNDEDKLALSPLIILNRKEEEPHNNLVPLPSDAEGCQFTLNNRWPLNQNWLYVDENGLHTTSIDREHESIAFMALSQVQVELILTCQNDNTIRKKRSLRTDPLGPYDYGANRWILSESIPFNPRRMLVNLIVDDINDNYPIFVGKENEPIAVGYPVGELEERILPRSLAELQATDADVGENAALVYWSAEEVLAVSPTTGFVHLRTGAKLQDDQTLTVSATDQNGQGLTGDIKLVVKLLDVNNIAVVTIQNAFLDQEKSVLEQLSTAVGYELRALRSVVISEDQDQNLRSRNVPDISASGTSLLVYVYGLIDREPVPVSRLTEDITNNAAMVSVINTVALEDHLVPVETIVTEREIGFFVATIVLSILLFIIMVLTAILFFLKWRKNKNYEEFSDNTSAASAAGLVDPLPKAEAPKARLDIEELKRSEQRLQDRLNAPFEAVTVESVPPRKETPLEAIADLLSPESNTPIVIQSVDKLKDADDDDDDEFGEKAGIRRKSVVTFNENVEKIIHVHNDNDTDSDSSAGIEVFRL